MFETFGRSWEVTKLSFGVIWKDKELLLYPILSIILSGIFLFLLVFPIVFGLIFASLSGKAVIFGVTQIVLLFIAYLGLAVISTFFNVCVVYTAKKRFEGGNAKFFESLGYALSKIHLVFFWGILAATIGVLFRMLDGVIARSKGIIKFILSAIRSLLGLAWQIMTIFVVQGIVYYDLGPFAAIKKSIEVIKKTWGESLVLYIGVYVVQSILFWIGFVFAILALIVAWQISWFAVIIVACVFVIYFVLLSLIFQILRAIYNTALFVYADTGKIPEGFDKQSMQDAFKKEEKTE